MKVTINQTVKKSDVVINQTTKQIFVTIQSIAKQNSCTISPLGKRGFKGFSNYEIAVTNGFTGTEVEWLDSQKNIDGGLIY
jgi:hypothetical protein